MKKYYLLMLLFFGFEAIQAQETLIPDSNFEQALIDNGYDDTLDGKVLTANISGVTYLNLAYRNISNLTGIQDFVSMQNLYCYNNQLTTLDVSGLTNLQSLFCEYNQLTTLDVSRSTNLQTLSCERNQLANLNLSGLTNLSQLYCTSNSLTNLNLSGLTNLQSLYCQANQLSSLDLRGLNISETMFCYGNPDLSCVSVDNIVQAKQNYNWYKDSFTRYSLDCSIPPAYTLIPDSNFEQALIENGYDDIYDGKVLTDAISGVTHLDLAYRNISDLTGIRDFVSLQNLQCYYNQLTNLDLRGLTYLQFLNCNNNQLTNLDVSGLTNLQILECYDNQFTNLNVSGLSNLQELYCFNNQLTTLDLRGLTSLWYLNTTSNPDLSCISVDNVVQANQKYYWNKDEEATFSLDCATEQGPVNAPATHLNFDGVNDKITGVNSNLPQGNSPRTIEAWVKNSSGNDMSIFNYGNVNGAVNEIYTLHLYNGIYVIGYYNDISTGYYINDGNWHHIAVSHDGTYSKIYVDGALINTSEKTYNTTGFDFQIGSNYRDGSHIFNYNGSLDDIRVWNVARTEEEINSSRNSELQGTEMGLVAYYKFNQGLAAGINTEVTTLIATTGTDATLTDFRLTGARSNWLAGSPVVSSPSANAQSFCGATTANSLVPAISSNIKWYSSLTSTTALSVSDIISTGTYFVSQMVNGIESTRTTVPVIVNSNVAPTFIQVPAICSGGSLSALPTTSDNGISGTWSPVLNNFETTEYIFTPNAGQCATSATMTITVNPIVEPTFTQVEAICSETSLSALSTLSNNGITGIWSPALNNEATTEYTFTPDVGQCARVTTMTIVVNQCEQVFCTGATVSNLTPSGSNIKWYSTQTATTPLLTTSILSTKTYYYTRTAGGVVSPRNAQAVVINQTSNAGSITGASGTTCYNSGKTLGLSTTSRGNVQWQSSTQPSGPFIPIAGETASTISTGNLIATTYYNAVVTNGVCPSKTTATATVFVRTQSNAGTISGGGVSVCAGTNRAVLRVSGHLGTIQWQSSTDDSNFVDIPSMVTASFTASNLSTTTYYRVIVTNGLGCTPAISPSVVITVKPLPLSGTITGTSSIPYNTSANLILLDSEPGSSLLWSYAATQDGTYFLGRQLINNTANYTSAKLTIDYYYRATVTKDGCSSRTMPFLVDVNSALKIDPNVSIAPFEVKIYPNPSTESFNIQTSAKGAVSVQVYDMQGRLVENTNSTQFGSRLAAGTYNVIVNQGANVKSLKVIKK